MSGRPGTGLDEATDRVSHSSSGLAQWRIPDIGAQPPPPTVEPCDGPFLVFRHGDSTGGRCGVNEREQEALAAHPDLHRLAALRDRGGWRFVHRETGSGDIDLTTGYHVWPDGSTDVLEFAGPTDARACRTNPDGAVVWSRDGLLLDVINGLLALPPPSAPGAPRFVTGTGRLLWTP